MFLPDDSSMHSPLDAPKRKKMDVKDVFNQDEDDTDGFGLARKRKLVPLGFTLLLYGLYTIDFCVTLILKLVYTLLQILEMKPTRKPGKRTKTPKRKNKISKH